MIRTYDHCSLAISGSSGLDIAVHHSGVAKCNEILRHIGFPRLSLIEFACTCCVVVALHTDINCAELLFRCSTAFPIALISLTL